MLMLRTAQCTKKRCLRLTACQSSGERSASCCYAKRSDCSLLSNRIMTLYHSPEPFLVTKNFFPLITGVLISPQPDQEGNKLQRQKIFMFIYPIYYQNWRNISTIYIHIKQDQHQTKYSHHQTQCIGKQVGLRTYQHPRIYAYNFLP